MSAHTTSSAPAVVLHHLTHTWPDGTTVLSDVSAAFGSGRVGIVGENGAGKSTLLRLIAGTLRPTAGSLTTSAEVVVLPQDLPLRIDTTMAELLGVADKVAALHAIESGDAAEEHFEVLADDWDVEIRAARALRMVGLEGFGLDRQVHELSGGEAMLAAIAGLRVSGAPIVLLDEPTNNLDRRARTLVRSMISSWPGVLIVVSHDIDLLDQLDETVEVRAGGLTVFGGGFTAFTEYLATEQEAARKALQSAEQHLRTERRQRVEAETKLARRARYAKNDFENKRRPKIVMNSRKQEAQESAGRLRTEFDDKIERAQQRVDDQAARLRTSDPIRIDLPDPAVPSGRRLATLSDGTHTHVIAGPERVALTGPNGAGKTRLLNELVGGTPTGSNLTATRATDRIGHLDQRIDNLDDNASLLDNVRAAAPEVPPEQVRAGLAQFLFRGDRTLQPVGQLSGGERFRVALARLLLASPPHELLVLDEPTNSLDLRSIDELVDALSSYRGALIVVSHDDRFLSRLGVDRWLELEDGVLVEGDPPAVPQ
ncbi:ABC-F family ATP-binding cassette domain-containing protein [Propionibacteriaceae bacterium Y1685]